MASDTDPAPGGDATAGKTAQLTVERAYSGDKFIGYRLTIDGKSDEDHVTLVWADQSILAGFRVGMEFVPAPRERIEYRKVEDERATLLAERDALRRAVEDVEADLHSAACDSLPSREDINRCRAALRAALARGEGGHTEGSR